MKNYFLALLLLFSMALNAQQTMSVDQVKSQWQNRSLKSDVENPNILQFVQIFQKAFPTYSGGELIQFSKSPKPYENNDKIVDLKNGYILYSEDDPDSDNDEQLQACVWRRTNGHRLVAVNLHRFSNEVDVTCFYDFNPQTKTLTPEKNLSQLFTPSFPGYRYRVFLPQNGKNLEIQEDFGYISITHNYSWDGMKPVNPQITIDHYNNFKAVYEERLFFAKEHPLAEYALVDVDKDGFPEIWLRSADKDYQCVFAVRLTCDYIGGQDDRTSLSFYKNAVCSSGNCGTGCMASVYYLVKESTFGSTLREQSEYDMQADEYGPSTYKLDDRELSRSEGEKMIRAFGEELTMNPRWIKLSR